MNTSGSRRAGFLHAADELKRMTERLSAENIRFTTTGRPPRVAFWVEFKYLRCAETLILAITHKEDANSLICY
jgi:hypothetical protein